MSLSYKTLTRRRVRRIVPAGPDRLTHNQNQGLAPRLAPNVQRSRAIEIRLYPPLSQTAFSSASQFTTISFSYPLASHFIMTEGEHLGLDLGSRGTVTSQNPNPVRDAGTSGGEGPTDNLQSLQNPPPTSITSSQTRTTRNTHVENVASGSNASADTQGVSLRSLPTLNPDSTALLGRILQNQQDVSAMLTQLGARPKTPDRMRQTSSATDPFSGFTTSLPIPPSIRIPGTENAFPALFTDPAAGVTAKKPDIADVIPGHVTDPFVNRESVRYRVMNCCLLVGHGMGCNRFPPVGICSKESRLSSGVGVDTAGPPRPSVYSKEVLIHLSSPVWDVTDSHAVICSLFLYKLLWRPCEMSLILGDSHSSLMRTSVCCARCFRICIDVAESRCFLTSGLTLTCPSHPQTN